MCFVRSVYALRTKHIRLDGLWDLVEGARRSLTSRELRWHGVSGDGPRTDRPVDQRTLRAWQAGEASDDQDFIEAVSDSWGAASTSSSHDK